ncbi:MAG TPA: hypothetical protein VF452_06420 [Candidatus Binatia bacterium]
MYVFRRQIAELFPMKEHVTEDIVVEGAGQQRQRYMLDDLKKLL